MLLSILVIGFGAGCGAVLRWALGLWLNSLFPAIPPGTLAANLIGGYVIGAAIAFFAALPERHPSGGCSSSRVLRRSHHVFHVFR